MTLTIYMFRPICGLLQDIHFNKILADVVNIRKRLFLEGENLFIMSFTQPYDLILSEETKC